MISISTPTKSDWSKQKIVQLVLVLIEFLHELLNAQDTIKLLIELKKCKHSKFKNRFDFNLVWENQSTKAFRAKSRFPFPTVLPSVNLIIIFSQMFGGTLEKRQLAMAGNGQLCKKLCTSTMVNENCPRWWGHWAHDRDGF